jgi:hypothetical protein
MNHKEIKMTMRYAKLSPDSCKTYVDNLFWKKSKIWQLSHLPIAIKWINTMGKWDKRVFLKKNNNIEINNSKW